MARLTYQDADGSWGLHGVSWDQLAALPPRVYGALVRLRPGRDGGGRSVIMDPAEICTGDLTHQVLVIQLPRGDRG